MQQRTNGGGALKSDVTNKKKSLSPFVLVDRRGMIPLLTIS